MMNFPKARPIFPTLNRRDFLKLMGASLALAGLPACTRQPIEKIVPYVKQPEELVPGKPLFFATAMTLRADLPPACSSKATKVIPPKSKAILTIPASLGATNIFHQAALLDLYDPDRSQVRFQTRPADHVGNFSFRVAMKFMQSATAEKRRGFEF